jgi:subtilase family serine protease
MRPDLLNLENRQLLSLVPSIFATVASPPAAQPIINSLVVTSGSSTPSGFLTPAQVRHAYQADQVYFKGGIIGDGSGQTIGITMYDIDPNIWADLATFDNNYNIQAPPSFVVLYSGNPLPAPKDGTVEETALDVEWAHAMAPGANILLAEGVNNTTSLVEMAQSVAARDGVCVVNMSWGPGSETNTADILYDKYLTQPSSHGVVYTVGSGDQKALGELVDDPAASPNVLDVGGTKWLPVDSIGNYIGGGTMDGEVVWDYTGGGISQFESQPSYQQGVGSQLGIKNRITTDVSFVGGTGLAVCDSYDDQANPWYGMMGTSAGAPCWAGIIAIADQGLALTGHGSLSTATACTMLYNHPEDFNDITVGNNGYYSATSGYDIPTGLGTPQINKVVSTLSMGDTMIAPTITFGQSASITYGSKIGNAPITATATDPNTGNVVPGWFAYSVDANTVLHAGTNQILPIVFTPNDTTDYTAVATTAAINVTPATLRITASDVTKVYGTSNPATYKYVIVGLMNGDSIPVSISTSVTQDSGPGSYWITPGASANSNYTIILVDGIFTVTPAPAPPAPPAPPIIWTPVYGKNHQVTKYKAVVLQPVTSFKSVVTYKPTLVHGKAIFKKVTVRTPVVTYKKVTIYKPAN